MKVLVTGCAGYVGSRLTARLLEAGHSVVGVDDLRYGNGFAVLPFIPNPNFEFRYLDACHPFGKMKDVDAVVPLAAVVGAPACDKSPTEAWRVNGRQISEVVRQFDAGQRLIYLNTNSGYGAAGREVTEEDEMRPISVYGQSKCAGEAEALKHSNAVVLRLATVFGLSPRQRLDLMVQDFTKTIVLDGEITLYEPHFRRNFVGIEDVVSAIAFFLENDLKGVYNLGDPGLNMTKLELARRVCDVLEVSREAVKVGDGKDPDQRDYLVSNAKVLAAGFGFEQGLDGAIEDVARLAWALPAHELDKMRNT